MKEQGLDLFLRTFTFMASSVLPLSSQVIILLELLSPFICRMQICSPRTMTKSIRVSGEYKRGKEWRVQTNVYGNGSTETGREERYNLWFDPSDYYHQYSILWTDSQIIWSQGRKEEVRVVIF